MADVKYRKIVKYLVSAVCTQPLHIGSASGDKEEVLAHPADGVPFIQASGIAGVMRQYYEKSHDMKHAEKLFGARHFEEGENSFEKAGKVRFSDGIFIGGNPVLELRPRVKIDPATGTCSADAVTGTNRQAGHKFNMEYIGAGAEFEFSIYLYDDGMRADLEEALSAIHGGVQFGGQKSNGCGFMELKSVKRKIFDMSDASDRGKWRDEETLPESEYEDALSGMKAGAGSIAAYRIIVKGSTEGELLVKSIAVEGHGKDAPDSANIRNAAKDYIVPGSSLKGAVRSRMEKIASYIGAGNIIEDTFGRTGDRHDDGKAGNIVFYDTVVGNREDNDLAEIKNRIHIDKFTGGVMQGGLFSEKNVSGRVSMEIVINDRNNPDRTCGLLLMALRDMACGIVNVGGGYSVGKGIIKVDTVAINDCKGKSAEAEVNFKESRIKDDGGIISKCMAAARAKEGKAV